ncbi:MAG TPA: hypothetical protein VHM70_19105 [Polyangiaceae bacterium]|nr:hypothetical protein [Polyangiaceae bacterium]
MSLRARRSPSIGHFVSREHLGCIALLCGIVASTGCDSNSAGDAKTTADTQAEGSSSDTEPGPATPLTHSPSAPTTGAVPTPTSGNPASGQSPNGPTSTTPTAGATTSNGGAPNQPVEPGPSETTPEGPPPGPNNAGGAPPTPPVAGSGGAAPSDLAGGAQGLGGANGAPDTSADPCATALFCDDFDDDSLGMPPGDPWTSDVNGGTVEVSSEHAFSGANAVHVSNSEGAYKRAYFSVQGAPVFPGAGAEMFGRMLMWLDATPEGSVHWTFIQGEGPSDDGSYDIYYRYGGQHEGRLMANFETQGKSTDCWDHSDTVMPTQRWTCIEWRYATATDEMQFWLDGTELTDIHVTGMGEGCGGQDLGGLWPAPKQFEILRLGWEKYQQSEALNAWIDDVVVGTERVGCPAMPQ